MPTQAGIAPPRGLSNDMFSDMLAKSKPLTSAAATALPTGGMLPNYAPPSMTPLTPSTEPGGIAIRGVNVSSQAAPLQQPVNAATLMGRTASGGNSNGSSNVQAILRRLLAPGNSGSVLPNYSN